jgi:TRAP-type C4-dicarboxylate transport system substrate-binding protein
VALSRHIYQAAVVLWCKRFFDGLPADLQEVLMTIPPGELEKGRKGVRVMNQRLVDVYKAEGIEVNPLSNAQIAAFKKATAAVEAKFMRSTSAKGKELLKALKAAR